jgi:SAM-dependent methyltransferase
VTSFSAFHWFADAESTQEMKRVLKPDGLIFIVNKNDVGDFSQGFRSIFRKYMTEDLPQVKNGYFPDKILQQAGFKNLKKTIFYTSEFFTVDQAMEYFQSVSGWNFVPQESKGEALVLLQEYANGRVKNGLIEKKIEIVTQLGFK